MSQQLIFVTTFVAQLFINEQSNVRVNYEFKHELFHLDCN